MKNLFNKENENKRYIKLNKPSNKRYLLIIVALVVFAGVLVTSNMWLPDGRSDATTYVKDKKYQFSSSELIVERVAYNPKLMIGEVRVKETVSNSYTRKKFDFTVTNEKGQELQSKVIRSPFKSTSKDNKTGVEWTIIQFAVYPDYYYFTLNIKEEGYAERGITFDYRKVPEVELIEKEADYLELAPELLMEVDRLKTAVETYTKRVNDILPEVNIAKNELEVASAEQKEAKQKAYDAVLKKQKEYQKQLDDAKADLDQKQGQLEEWEMQ